jgi:AraC-like DNA-binding protein
MHLTKIGSVEFKAPDSLPFEAEIEATAVGSLVFGQMAGTIKQSNRQARNVADDGHDGYLLFVNRGDTMLTGTQVGRDYRIGPGQAALVSASEPLKMIGGDRNCWANVVIPREVLAATFKQADDKLAFCIDSENEALGLLKRYCHMIEAGPPVVAPALIAHVSETIVDLVGLAAGANGEAAEIAGLRGLRAARLQAILANIRKGFTDPEISARSVAQSLGLSVRYVHELLEETGLSFAEHVLELRLQQTRRALSNRTNNGRLVSEVAYSCGFTSLSYFNRAFRHRFGCTPGSTR